MSELSYSFHISAKKHAITNMRKLRKVDKHNNRKYENVEQERPQHQQNKILIGTNDLVADVKKIYSAEFDEAVKKYNAKQKRAERKIKDYLAKLAKDSQTDIAVEAIIQVGHKDFWDNYEMSERQKMTPLFEKQIQKLQKILPNFKIAHAVIHYDESSPHIQLVGIPVKNNCNRGLEKQVSKRSIFTQEALIEIQDKMREDIEKDMRQLYGQNINLKPKEKGRNKDLLIKDYIKLKEEQDKELKEQAKKTVEKLQVEIAEEIQKTEEIKNEVKKEQREWIIRGQALGMPIKTFDEIVGSGRFAEISKIRKQERQKDGYEHEI